MGEVSSHDNPSVQFNLCSINYCSEEMDMESILTEWMNSPKRLHGDGRIRISLDLSMTALALAPKIQEKDEQELFMSSMVYQHYLLLKKAVQLCAAIIKKMLQPQAANK